MASRKIKWLQKKCLGKTEDEIEEILLNHGPYFRKKLRQAFRDIENGNYKSFDNIDELIEELDATC